MHNVWLIARREYLERVTTRAFIVSTVLIPVLMCGFVFGGTYLERKARNGRPSTHLADRHRHADDTQFGLGPPKRARRP